MIGSIVLTIVLMALIALGWRIWLASKGILRSYSEIKHALQDLLDRGFEDGILIITPKGTKEFIQFNKYIVNRNKYGIELAFPNAEWSQKYFGKLKEYCDSEEIEYEIQKGVAHPMEFLCIDCDKDIDLAHRLVGDIAKNIFALSESQQFHVLLHNAKA